MSPNPNSPRSSAAAARADWLAAERTDFLVDRLGVTALARLLDVSVRQVSRWRRGNGEPGPDAALRLLALDYVLASVLQLWQEPVAMDWLQSPNAHLDGARPLDVLVVRGPWEVVAAVHAEMAGAFG